MPPRGSFRSGLYRLIRAVMINQRPLASPANNATATNSGRVATGTGASTATEARAKRPHPKQQSPWNATGGQTAAHQAPGTPAAAVIVSDVRSGRMAPPVEFPGGRSGPADAALHWLARAFVLRHLLPWSARPTASAAAYPARVRATGRDDHRGAIRDVSLHDSGYANQTLGPSQPREARPAPPSAFTPLTGTGSQGLSAVSGWRPPPSIVSLVTGAFGMVGTAADSVRSALTPAETLTVPRYVEVAAVATLTVVALFLRTWDLSGVPAGIHPDETAMALEAIRSIDSGGLGIWSGVTLGHPAGYAHWMSLIFRVGGADVTTMRLASAIPGIVMVPIVYLLVRSLFPFRVALLSSAMLVFSFWFVIQSRIAFGGITAVLMAMLAIWLLIETVRGRRWWIAVSAGVVLGLGLYTFKTFLIYFAGIWGVALLAAAMHPEVRRSREIWLALAVSVIVGGPMPMFYATSGFIGPNLNDLYQVSLSSPSTWLRIPGLAIDAVLLVHLPVQGNTTDGAPSIPVLPILAALLFWVGLAATLLSIRDRRSQLLLAGWLIGMAPVLFVPGVESRRYLLGIFFLLIFVAIGADALMNVPGTQLRQRVRWPATFPVGARQLAAAGVVVAAVAFIALFSFQNLREVDRWSEGESVRWFFNYDYHQALLSLQDTNPMAEIRLYSARHSFDSSIRRFLLPGAKGADGSRELGGEGAVPATHEVAGDTIVVLLDEYLPLADALESEFPGAVKLAEGAEGGREIFAVFLVPGSPSN